MEQTEMHPNLFLQKSLHPTPQPSFHNSIQDATSDYNQENLTWLVRSLAFPGGKSHTAVHTQILTALAAWKIDGKRI